MPELPEVETVRRGLHPVLVGHVIQHVEQHRPDLRFPLPERFTEQLRGDRIDVLARRGKYLLAHLSGGSVLVMHLGMTGRFTVKPEPSAAAGKMGSFVHDAGGLARHDHVVFHMAGGAVVTYNDARRFGFMLLVPASELDQHPLFRTMGAEPLGNEFNAAYLAARAAGRSVDLKAFLMDQRIVAGLGNIYVCEALHRAGLNPNRAARTLADRKGRPAARAEALALAVTTVLTEAIAAGGSTLRDYRHADGELGYFQHAFAVYGRTGEPCPRPGCGGIVRRAVHAGRSTFFCPVCQK
jgi:formamidopyrimidine-DNA glycosylase